MLSSTYFYLLFIVLSLFNSLSVFPHSPSHIFFGFPFPNIHGQLFLNVIQWRLVTLLSRSVNPLTLPHRISNLLLIKKQPQKLYIYTERQMNTV